MRIIERLPVVFLSKIQTTPFQDHKVVLCHLYPSQAQLDGPEEISQTQVLPKNHSLSDRKIQVASPKNISSLDGLAPPEEISGLGFSPAGLSANLAHVTWKQRYFGRRRLRG